MSVTCGEPLDSKTSDVGIHIFGGTTLVTVTRVDGKLGYVVDHLHLNGIQCIVTIESKTQDVKESSAGKWKGSPTYLVMCLGMTTFLC